MCILRRTSEHQVGAMLRMAIIDRLTINLLSRLQHERLNPPDVSAMVEMMLWRAPDCKL